MLIKNGTIVSSAGLEKADVLIESGKISRIGKGLAGGKNNGERIIDASDLFILPGAIDIHVHVREPGAEYKEDWGSASSAAAHGGVTAFFDMPNNKVPITSAARAKEKLEIAGGKSRINYGIYGGIDFGKLDALREMRELVVGYKLYMAETTGITKGRAAGRVEGTPQEGSSMAESTWAKVAGGADFEERAFAEVAKLGRVLVVHAESEEINRAAKLKVRGRKDELAHADSRPPASEVAGISKAIELAGKYGGRTHITHVTTSLGAIMISRAKAGGAGNLSADTTPAYLYFTRNSMRERKDSFLKINPPLRVETDKEALWRAVGAGKVDVVASDHAPHTREEKSKGIWDAPSGVPLLDYFLPSLLNGVNEGKIKLEEVVRAAAESPAGIFGIEGRGYVKEGYWADLAIVDLKGREEVSADKLLTKCGWSPFEGKELRGKVKYTLVGGEVVYEDGVGVNEKARGRQIVL